jgi:GNAT superfamily N-acetyltransferase
MLGNPDHPVGGLSVRRPQGVELRPLGREDFALALAMVRELYSLPDSDTSPHRTAYEAYVNDPDAAPFLAIADGEPAGLILFRFRRRLNRATFEGWVSDLYVREPFRGRGIGRMLLSAVVEEWRLRQGHAIVLEVGDDRTAARQLYATAGFHEAGRLWEMVPLRGAPAPVDAAVLRPVEPRDAEAVTRLLAELGRPVPAPEREAAVHRTFVAQINRRDQLASIAEVDGVPAGVVVAELRPVEAPPGRHENEDVIVLASTNDDRAQQRPELDLLELRALLGAVGWPRPNDARVEPRRTHRLRGRRLVRHVANRRSSAYPEPTSSNPAARSSPAAASRLTGAVTLAP